MNGGSTAPTARSWARVAAAAGGSAVAAYFMVAAMSFVPFGVRRAAFFAIGPLMAVGILGLGQLLRLRRDSVSLQVAIVLHIVAAGVLSAMAVVQNTNITLMRARAEAAVDHAARELVRQVMLGVDNVQLGLDVTFDLWITTGAIFLAVALARQPGFGRAFAWSGVVMAAAVILLNLWTFPHPPGQAGLVDLGPGLALWYAAVLARLAWTGRRPASGIATTGRGDR